jgi:hypothetical protein
MDVLGVIAVYQMLGVQHWTKRQDEKNQCSAVQCRAVQGRAGQSSAI